MLSTRARRGPPDDLIALYQVNQARLAPAPQMIAIVDDLLTTGCHFKAMKSVLAPLFLGVSIVGLFIARRIPDADFPDFEALDP